MSTITTNWVDSELSCADFGDERLTKRFIGIAKRFASTFGSNISSSFSSWKEIKAAYRFFSNQKVTVDTILIPLSFEIKTDATTIAWTLESIKGDKKSINASFAQRDMYQSTDFADIGDNESDPFLMNMMNLGFIEHGNSGFYDSNGNDMGARNNHGHAH